MRPAVTALQSAAGVVHLFHRLPALLGQVCGLVTLLGSTILAIGLLLAPGQVYTQFAPANQADG